jgi:hypothetical protein
MQAASCIWAEDILVEEVDQPGHLVRLQVAGGVDVGQHPGQLGVTFLGKEYSISATRWQWGTGVGYAKSAKCLDHEGRKAREGHEARRTRRDALQDAIPSCPSCFVLFVYFASS